RRRDGDGAADGHLVPAGAVGRGEPRRGPGRRGGVRPARGAPGAGPAAGEGGGTGAGRTEEEPADDVQTARVPPLLQTRAEGAGGREGAGAGGAGPAPVSPPFPRSSPPPARQSGRSHFAGPAARFFPRRSSTRATISSGVKLCREPLSVG